MTLVTSVWRSEDNLEKLALSYHAGPGTRTQVIGLGGKYFYLLNNQPHLPTSQFLIKTMGQEASPLLTQYPLFPSMAIIYIDQDNRFDIPFEAS